MLMLTEEWLHHELTGPFFFSPRHLHPSGSPLSQLLLQMFIVVIWQSQATGPDSHAFLKPSSIRKISPISRPLGCESSSCLWPMANEVDRNESKFSLRVVWVDGVMCVESAWNCLCAFP